MARRQLTDHEKWCLDIIEKSGMEVGILPAPGSLRRRPSKRDFIYPLWRKQQEKKNKKKSS